MLAVTVAAAAAIRLTAAARAAALAGARGRRAARPASCCTTRPSLVLAPLGAVAAHRAAAAAEGQRLAVGAAVGDPVPGAAAAAARASSARATTSARRDAYARITPHRPAAARRHAVRRPRDRGHDRSRYELGFLALVDAVALLAFADTLPPRLRRAGCSSARASLPLVAIIAVSALFQPFALTRYTAVAAPFMLVAIARRRAGACRARSASRCSRVALAGGVIGIVAAQTSSGQWPDVRAAMADIGADWQHGDVVVGLNNLALQERDRLLRARAARGAPARRATSPPS